MKQRKELKCKFSRRFVAVLCVMTLLVNACMIQAFANTNTPTYTNLTFSDFFGEESATITCDSATSQYSMYGKYDDSLHNLKIEGLYNFTKGAAAGASFVCFGGENTSGSVFLGTWTDNASGERLMLGRAGANMEPFNSGNYANQYVQLSLAEYNATANAPQLTSFYGQTNLKISVAFSFADPTSTSTNLTATVTVNDVYTKSVVISGMDATAAYFDGAICVKSKSAPITLTSIDQVSPYTDLTFTDFFGEGYEEVTFDSTTPQYSKYGKYNDSLHNLKIEGYYNFTKSSSAPGSFISFGGQNTAGSVFLGTWSDNASAGERLMFGRAGVNMTPFNGGGYDGQYIQLSLNEYNNVAASLGVAALDSFYGQENLKISVAFSFADPTSTSTNLTMIITVNDIYTQKKTISSMDATASYFEGAMCVKSCSAPVTLTSIEKEKPEETPVTNLTFTDFFGEGNATVTCDSTTQQTGLYGKYNDSLHNLQIEGYYNFGANVATASIVCFGGNNTAGSIFLGSWSDGSENGRIMFGRAGVNMTPFNGGGYEGQYIQLSLKEYNSAATAAGITTLNSFYGQDLKIRVSFSFADPTSTSTDLTMSITVNDIYAKSMVLSGMNATASYFDGAICVKSNSAPITLKSIAKEPGGSEGPELPEESPYTSITFTDFGLNEKFSCVPGYHEYGTYGDSLHNLKVEGYYNFSSEVTGSSVVAFGGKTANADGSIFLGPWGTKGTDEFLMIGRAKANMIAVNSGAYAGQYIKLSLAEYNATPGVTPLESFFNQDDLKISVAFSYSDPEAASTDLLVTITINDVFTKSVTMSGQNPTDLGATLFVKAPATGSEISLRSLFTKITPLTLRMDNFQITEAEYVQYEKDNLDGTSLEMELTLPGKGSDASIILGATDEEGTNGVRLSVAGTQDECDLKLSANADAVDFEQEISEELALTTLLNSQMRLAIKTEYVDSDADGQKDDVKLRLYFNNILYDNMMVVIPDYAGYMGNYILFCGSVNNPIVLDYEIPELVNLTHRSLTGIADGVYTATETSGFVLSGKYSDTLVGTRLTHTNIKFSKTETVQLNYAGKTSYWYGIRFAVNGEKLKVELLENDTTITPIDIMTKDIAGVALVDNEYELTIELIPSGTDVKLGVYFNGKLYNGEYYVLKDAVDKLGKYVSYYIPKSADGSITIGTPEAEPVPNSSFQKMTFNSYDFESGRYDSSKSENGRAFYSNKCKRNDLDKVIFSDKVNFSDAAGVQLIIGGKNSPWEGTIIENVGNGNLAFRSYKGTTATFRSEVAGVNLTGDDFELMLSFEYVDYDGDGLKDDVKLGVWFDGKAYGGRWMYLLDEAPYLGKYMGIYIPNAETSFTLETYMPPIDFEEYGFTSNWAVELGLKKKK